MHSCPLPPAFVNSSCSRSCCGSKSSWPSPSSSLRTARERSARSERFGRAGTQAKGAKHTEQASGALAHRSQFHVNPTPLLCAPVVVVHLALLAPRPAAVARPRRLGRAHRVLHTEQHGLVHSGQAGTASAACRWRRPQLMCSTSARPAIHHATLTRPCQLTRLKFSSATHSSMRRLTAQGGRRYVTGMHSAHLCRAPCLGPPPVRAARSTTLQMHGLGLQTDCCDLLAARHHSIRNYASILKCRGGSGSPGQQPGGTHTCGSAHSTRTRPQCRPPYAAQ